MLIALTCLGLFATWALGTARYGGPDEPAHVLRAASVARGQLLGSAVDGLVGGFRAVEVPTALATGDPRCFRHDRRQPATCAVADAGVSGLRTAATSAGTYPPWYYLMVGVPVRWFGGAADVVWYRLVAAGWCAVAIAAAMARARRTGMLLVVAAIAPASWFLFGVVNPNSLEIALALLAWVGVERVRVALRDTPGHPPIARSEMWWIGAPAGLAIAIRPVALAAVATMVVVLAVLESVGRRDAMPGAAENARRSRIDRRAWAVLLAAPAIAVGATAAWSLWSDVVVTDQRAASTLGPLARLAHSAAGTAQTIRELAGSLGWLEFSAPWIAQAAWWAAVGVVGTAVWRRGGATRAAWWLVAASMLGVPIVFETVLAGQSGFIWQGRYSIPTAIGLVIVGSTDAAAGTLRRSSPWWRRSRALFVGGGALAEILTFWSVLRRYAVGSSGSWLFRGQQWHPQVPPLALIAVNAVLVCCLWIACMWPEGWGSRENDPRGSS
ncbi:MAG: hypothetical protein JWN62_1582 [Acidimicrobiales bacterium]|nr:hypothetical protein [Acidimicrobiales bacterium]